MLDDLQKKFATPQIKFASGNGDLPKVTISTAAGAAEIYLHGAHVTKFQPTGQEQVLYMSSTSAFKADKPIRGGVPICWPWFGPSTTDPKFPMHGVARTNEWAVESTRDLDNDRAGITLRLEPNDATRALWPHDFVLRYTVTVGAALELELEMTNRDKAGLIISEALHTYFAIGDIEKVSLNGLTGTTYFDKAANVRKIEERDPVTLSAETDCVYLNTRAAVTINDPILRRRIRVEKSGSSSTVVWNPFEAKAKTMADVGPGEWRKYICIEAVNALENSVTVAPGATHKFSTTLKVLA